MMKTYKLLLAILLLTTACQNAKKDAFRIELTGDKTYDGLRSYVKQLNENGQEVIIDTAVASNGKIVFKGSVESPEIVFINVDSYNGTLMMFLENYDIAVTLDTTNLSLSKVEGSPLNTELSKFNEQISVYREEMIPLTNEFREAFKVGDSLKMIAIQDTLTILGNQSIRFPLEYAREHPKSYLSLYLIDSQIGRSTQIGYEDIEKTYSQLDSSLKSNSFAKKLEKKLELERIKFEKTKVTAIGAKAPEFSASTPTGEQLSLSEVYTKGKITIVDFWAAWCGPCRRENPRLVKTYNKYHDKGLEIIGVSLDGNRNQKDPKAAWIKAIEDDKLDWHHVSNLQYFGPIAQQYNVNAIPAMFILDNEGTIVGKNLRGMALENKVAELLQD